MRAVADVKLQPFGQGEIAERGMLHEEIVPAGRQELVREGEEARHAVPQLPLHRAGIRPLGRFGCGRGGTAGGNPSDIEIHKLGKPLSHGSRPAPHRGLGAALSVRIERAHWRRAATACSRAARRSAALGGTYTVTNVPASAGRGLARGASLQASAAPARPHANRRATVAPGTLIPKIVRVNLLRRHPIALALIALLLVSALRPSPPLVDAVAGAPPADVDLVRPTLYTLLAPVSNVLDALTF